MKLRNCFIKTVLPTAFINASNNAIQDKTFRIKANINCQFFNNTRCNLCETAAAAAAVVFATAAKKNAASAADFLISHCAKCVKMQRVHKIWRYYIQKKIKKIILFITEFLNFLAIL